MGFTPSPGWHHSCDLASSIARRHFLLTITPSGPVNTIAEEIARYLREHPDAADSLDGIRQWWLPRVRLQEATAQVEGALEELLGRGVVVRQVMPDGTVLYRRVETDLP